MNQSYVLILIPGRNGGPMLPPAIGGYETFADARKAGEVALRYPPNVSDEDYAAFHARAAKDGRSSSRPDGHPAAWADYTVIPGAAATTPVGRETLKLK